MLLTVVEARFLDPIFPDVVRRLSPTKRAWSGAYLAVYGPMIAFSDEERSGVMRRKTTYQHTIQKKELRRVACVRVRWTV